MPAMATTIRPCIERRCTEYTEGTRCERHQAEWEARRRADPSVTGRRGTSGAWRRARAAALRRDENTCQGCGLDAAEVALRDGHLEVHHLDGNAMHNALENLLTLCTLGCHGEAERINRERRRRSYASRGVDA
jgi:5-methylcytosine-specific restriction endonuclease McrA